jgi:N-acetyl-anhydromuramyl-L-alanine amidase AmpD
MPRPKLKLPDSYTVIGAAGAVVVCISLIIFVRSFLAAPVSPHKPDPNPASRWKYIVVHHSASDSGSAEVFGEWHRQKGWKSLGYHFVIGNGAGSGDGEVEAGPRWADQSAGAHCLTRGDEFNQHGIGSCLVGNFEQTRPTPAQLAALNDLIARLAREYHIRPENILGHNEAFARAGETKTTQCPGRNMDMAAVRRAAPH